MHNDEKKLVILAVLDGWGIAPPGPGNAIYQARTINIDRFWSAYPHTQLTASGQAVGLPRNESGNTETGHLNLGAGKIIYQDLARINMSIADGTFFENEVLVGAIDHAKKNNSNLHLMGLTGAGGVHSNIEHLFALIRLVKQQQFSNIFLHLFTDGRDSPPTASLTYINKIREVLKRENIGQIATLMGRYWAMDRDLRWKRTQTAYEALTLGKGHLVKTPEEAIEMSYSQGKTDEFIEPSIMSTTEGKPLATISDNDAVIFFNFRIDRPRQLSKAFVLKDFEEVGGEQDFDPFMVEYEKKHNVETKDRPTFKREKILSNLYFVTMTEYSKQIAKSGAKVAFPPEVIGMPLGRILSTNNIKQLRMSESEKERFVTFYFNGMREEPFPLENWLIVPSPQIATYDQKPEMSATQLTDKLIEQIKRDSYSFVLVNFANADMVGHTGSIGPTVRACEIVDECMGKLANVILAYGGTLLITADHGNAEEMINAHSGTIETEHSANPVPFIAVSREFTGKAQMLQAGILADVAPTVLSLLGLKIPSDMTGRNLLVEVTNDK